MKWYVLLFFLVVGNVCYVGVKAIVGWGTIEPIDLAVYGLLDITLTIGVMLGKFVAKYEYKIES